MAAGLLAFIGLVAAQHPMRSDLPARDHFISEYAKGSTAYVQVLAFVLPPDVERTTGGQLHDLGTLAAFAGLAVAAAASLRLDVRRDYRLSLAALTAVLLLTVPILVALGIDAPGVGQRAFVLVGCAFQWRLAVELSR